MYLSLKKAIIGSDNGLSPGWRQAIIWTNAGLLSIGIEETHFNEIQIEIQTFSFKKMYLKMLTGLSLSVSMMCYPLNSVSL